MLKDYPPILLKSKELVEAWRNTLQAFDQFTEQSIKGCFFHIKMKVMLRILHHLIEENKLSKYDEKIFEYFEHLMHHYQSTIQLFYDNEEKIKTGKAKEILKGICSVLSSQLKQFKENQLVDQGISDPKASVNPIKLEKDRFLTEQKISILNLLDELEKQWMTHSMEESIVNNRKYLTIVTKEEDKEIEFIEQAYNQLINDLLDSLYKGYIKKSAKGIQKLNDFHLRKAANFYYESIKQERENVEAIIKIQVNALEEEMKNENYENDEQQIIQEILHTIREAYQHVGKEIESLELFFKEAENNPNKVVLFTPQEFREYLKEEGMKSYINDINIRRKVKLKVDEPCESRKYFEIFTNEWESLKDDILKIYIEKMNLQEFIEKINKSLKDNIDLSNTIIKLFSEFVKNYEIQKDNINEDVEYIPIIDGIYETISIKVESLTENTESFSCMISKVNQNIQEEINPSVLENVFGIIILERYNRFINEPINNHPIEKDSFIQWGEEYLKKELEEGFELFTKRIKLIIEKLEQEANKKTNKFLKEYLLFEISTYEEIVNYSVSRLRQEDDAFVCDYVKNIDRLTLDLEKVLEEYKIELVEPVPHEKFNGREHEVLMAEVREGFNKGEIIKTLNKGYRYNNQIILKANVVAGK